MKRKIALSVFGILAGAGLIRDGIASFQSSALDLMPLGELWYRLDPPSLNLVQAVIERYLTPHLWDPALVTILQAPTWALPLGLFVIIAIWMRLRP